MVHEARLECRSHAFGYCAGRMGADGVAQRRAFSGFPWSAVSYAHVDGSLSAFAPICGADGINFLGRLYFRMCGAPPAGA